MRDASARESIPTPRSRRCAAVRRGPARWVLVGMFLAVPALTAAQSASSLPAALSDPDPIVRIRALDAVLDPQLLGRIALTDPDR